mmetsp:Transcript_9126/g.37631  ORF Transcript_9126/g.37631 Transcript_9126/m.37631 type:complete len:126 (+) Transcript_9126:3-380(+)
MRRAVGGAGLLVMNVAVQIRPHAGAEYLELLQAARAAFAHAYFLEAGFFNRVLVAHDWPPPASPELLVARAAALPARCGVPALARGASTLYSLAEADWAQRFYRHRWRDRDNCYRRGGGAACLLL